MKIRWVPLVLSVLTCSVLLLGGCGPGKYVPKANEEIYGTWTNPESAQQKVVISPSGWLIYAYTDDASEIWGGTGQIVQKWTDSQGVIWYKTFSTITSGYGGGRGGRSQSLYRLSKGGTVMEAQEAVVSDFDPKQFPAKIDPKDRDNYRIYFRSAN
jgi:hypothetical protein